MLTWVCEKAPHIIANEVVQLRNFSGDLCQRGPLAHIIANRGDRRRAFVDSDPCLQQLLEGCTRNCKVKTALVILGDNLLHVRNRESLASIRAQSRGRAFWKSS